MEVARPVRRATARKPPAEKADPAPRRRPYLARTPMACQVAPTVPPGESLRGTGRTPACVHQRKRRRVRGSLGSRGDRNTGISASPRLPRHARRIGVARLARRMHSAHASTAGCVPRSPFWSPRTSGGRLSPLPRLLRLGHGGLPRQGDLRSDPRGNATRPNELRAPGWDPQGARGHRWQFPNRDRPPRSMWISSIGSR